MVVIKEGFMTRIKAATISTSTCEKKVVKNARAKIKPRCKQTSAVINCSNPSFFLACFVLFLELKIFTNVIVVSTDEFPTTQYKFYAYPMNS